MDDNSDDFFFKLKEELTTYVHLRLELFKVSSYEKIAKVTASLFSGLILIVLAFFVIVFASICAGFYFSALTSSNITGFGIIAGIYMLLLVIIIVFRKQLFEKMFVNKMIEILFENDDNQTN